MDCKADDSWRATGCNAALAQKQTFVLVSPRLGERHKQILNRINEATEIGLPNRYTPFRYMDFYFTLRKITTMVLAQTIFAVSIVLVAVLPQAFAMFIDWSANAKRGTESAQ
jgi:hypothetical protein